MRQHCLKSRNVFFTVYKKVSRSKIRKKNLNRYESRYPLIVVDLLSIKLSKTDNHASKNGAIKHKSNKYLHGSREG